jgi:hypothetical protein
MFYGDCVKMCKDYAPELWRQKNWMLHHSNAPSHTSFFTRECLTKNNVSVASHPSYFSLFPHLKTKLKGCHFFTSEVIEAESQAVLYTFREHNFQNTFKNGRSTGNGAYTLKRNTSRVMVASTPKLVFDQMAEPVLKIMDDYIVSHKKHLRHL